LDEHDGDQPDEKPRDPSEGVRIIGAEEAAEALERGDVVHRRPADQPRFGDRPPAPQVDGPRPSLRFPLGSSSDPSDIERPPVAPVDPPVGGEAVDLPHWTEPPTGQVPKVVSREPAEGEDLEAWASFASASPRWRDAGSKLEAEHDYHDMTSFADDDDPPLGALDESERPSEEDWFSFADLDDPVASGRSVFADAAVDEEALDDDTAAEAAPAPRPGPRRRAPAHSTPTRGGGERDIGQAVAVGAVFGAIALALFSQGPSWAMAIVLPVITVAAAELFAALRQGGYQPIALVGLVATVGMVLGAYHRGEAAIPAVLFLTIVVCLLWYLFNAGGDQPVLNIGATLIGVLWVGMLGAYAALLLAAPHGIGLLLGAVLGTVAYDVGGLFIGRNAGRQPLSTASPNKTVEGLLGGCVVAFVVCVLVAGRITPWDSFADAAMLGLVVAIAAPLGDLCESLLKRDLGLKDMGSLLPGHGGFLDRFDAMLFVLPSVWYLARLSDFFV
jgi:phosphatidate cytidylyltransferase